MSGIRTILLALLLASPTQDPSLDALIEQLSDDRVERREAAVEALARLGPDRLPELRKWLDGLAPEPKGRLAVAIGRIEDSIRVLEYLPPYRPVSLDLAKVSAREAMKELADRSGLPIDLATCPPGPVVTVRVENVPPLQALNEICRAAMLGWMIQNPADWRGRLANSQPSGIRIHTVVPYYHRPMAVQYLRHYRIHAYLATVHVGGAPKQQLSLSVQPSPLVRPHSLSSFRLTEAVDGEGGDVLAVLPRPTEGFRTLEIWRRGARLSAMFPEAAPPRKLSRLKGAITFRYPREVRWVRFANPESGPSAPVTALGCEMSLAKYSREGTSHDVALTVTWLENKGDKILDLETDLPFDYAEVEVVTASGERLSSSGCSGFGGGATRQIKLSMKGTKDEAAKEIRIPWADRFVEDAVEFDLRDVVPQ